MQLDLIDVFGSAPLRGNPLAVVHGGEGLSDAEMLRLTQWLGFSETTFLLPPTDPAADYRVRIFYPAGELPFAGHPTLGTCRAWLDRGGKPVDDDVIQQCGVGLVPIRRDGDRLAFRAPPSERSPLSPDERAEAARLAGVPEDEVIEAVNAANGPKWKLLRLASAEAVLAAAPQPFAEPGTDIGLVGPSADGKVDFELRAFFANQQGRLIEDPVTGSLNAACAQYLFGAGLATGSYVAGQGKKVGADGRVHCAADGDDVWIGGLTHPIAVGAALTLPA